MKVGPNWRVKMCRYIFRRLKIPRHEGPASDTGYEYFLTGHLFLFQSLLQGIVHHRLGEWPLQLIRGWTQRSGDWWHRQRRQVDWLPVHSSPQLGEISPHMGDSSPHMGESSPHMGEISPHMEDSSPHMEEISNHPPSPTCHQSVFESYKSGFWAPIYVCIAWKCFCDISKDCNIWAK